MSSARASAVPGPAAAPLRVLVGGDQQLLVLGVRHTVEADGLRVVGQAEAAAALARTAAVERPDLCLVLAPFPGGVVAAVQAVLTASPDTVVVVLSADDAVDGDSLLRVMAAGADGWLSLDLPPAVLGRTLRAVHAGEPGISRKHVTRLLRVLRRSTQGDVVLRDGRSVALTPREQEVFSAVSGGGSTRDVALVLGMSEATVRWHVAALVRKLGVGSRAELVGLQLRR
ncbi:LuxR C-terminal-related transcriptional regulator [Vallicoccus soli]|uniref:DNA-binding response regulator n=1 Tax=Vallicoccus soli TaxID=2339232 RepID=A0A3A3ZKV7_9ACTN|nr:response regulator transcription factor [Vallicoccus soli]RJK96716.1 DNA-binding response regulator [Vallicoccus soli]